MNYIVDTHVLIWAITDELQLSHSAKQILDNERNNIFVSTISFWEVALKFSLGKLNIRGLMPDELPDLALMTGFKLISLLP